MRGRERKTEKPRGAVDLGRVVPKKLNRRQLEDVLERSRAYHWDVKMAAIQEGLAHFAALMDDAVLTAHEKQDATLTEIGEELGVSQQAVSKRFVKRLGLKTRPGRRS